MDRALLDTIAELYQLILDERKPADYVIARFLRARPLLGRTGRAVVVEAVYEALRRTLLYRRIISEQGLEPNARSIVFLTLLDTAKLQRMELFKLWPRTEALWMERLAGYYDRARDFAFIADETERLALRHSMPLWFTEELLKSYSQDELEQLLSALNRPAQQTLRVNIYKITPEKLAVRLRAEQIKTRVGRLAAAALIVEGHADLFRTEAFKEGFFELQDEASQRVSEIVDPKPGWKVLDACAGAGGKSLHLGALMRGRGEVHAYDSDSKRLSKLPARVKRSGLQNIRVVTDLERFRERYNGKLDAVLIDAPCSGSGTLRRSPDIKLHLTPTLVEEMQGKQRKCLATYAPMLRRGGRLVYATCSLLPAENREVLEEFIAEHADFCLLECSEYYPHIHNSDGFFIALLERA
ncbi:MAG: class I SAM-dependent methyltransferase [Candidatus Bathyarchaeia archaeon]